MRTSKLAAVCPLILTILGVMTATQTPVVAADCPCAGVADVMNPVDAELKSVLKGLPPSNPPQGSAFHAALDAASLGDLSQLDTFVEDRATNGAFLDAFGTRDVVALFRAAADLKHKATQGTLTDADFTTLDIAINALPAGPGRTRLQDESRQAKTEHTLCKILCALAALAPDGPGSSGGGLGPAGGGYLADPGPPGNGDVAGQPTPVALPVPEAVGPTVSYEGKVLLLNLGESGAPVGYGIGHTKGRMLKTYHLPNDDGQKGEHLFAVPSSGRWVTEFDRGDGVIVPYSLDEGSYEWVVTDEGLWDLKRRTFEVTIDNSDLAGPVPYQVDGNNDEVAEGGSNEYSSNWPISIVHDQGDGTISRKRLKKNGDYLWRIAENLLDLYHVDEAQPEKGQ